MDVIAVKGLDFSYGNTQILKNINFTVPEGRFAVLLGPNGAGKSTLITVSYTHLIGLHQGDTLHFRCPMVCVTMAHEGNIPLRDSLLKQKKIRPFKTAVHSGVSGK